MRMIILISLIIAGLASIATAPAEAASIRYPYCLQGRSSPGWSNCNFPGWAECRAMARGRHLTCVENPFYRGRHR
jgi:hypothetical protein